MYASIQARNFIQFYCRVNKNPVLSFSNILVYELVDSSVPNDIVKTVRGTPVGVFRHIALDTDGIGYLYDVNTHQLSGRIGPCDYIADV